MENLENTNIETAPVGSPVEASERYRVEATEGSITLEMNEADGSLSQLDVSPFATLMVNLGSREAVGSVEEAMRTSRLGELSCSDDVHFYHGDVEVPAAEGIKLLGDGIYRALQFAMAHLTEAHEDASLGD